MAKKIPQIDKNKYPSELGLLIEHMNKVNAGDKEELKKLEEAIKNEIK